MKGRGKITISKKGVEGNKNIFSKLFIPVKVGARRKINIVESDEEIDREEPGPSKRAEVNWLDIDGIDYEDDDDDVDDGRGEDDEDDGEDDREGEDESGPVESDVQDPQILIKDLEPHVIYVLVAYEGSHFPGIVEEVKHNDIKVSCMTPIPSKIMKTLWKWPEQADKCWYSIENIVAIISTPILLGSRGKYKVQEAEKYW